MTTFAKVSQKILQMGIMKEEIKQLNLISDYGEMVGAETLHPLVNVVDFSKLPPLHNIAGKRMLGYYAVYLKGPKYSELDYGRSMYHYEEGALVFFAPGQVIGTKDDGEFHQMKTRVLMFHPDLLKNSYLANLISRYSFFSYNVNEALFPTEDERKAIITFFDRIEYELRHFDSYSLPIVIDYIKLILDCCVRFYNRQFATEHVQNRDILACFEQLVDEYFNSGIPFQKGVPTVSYCADKLHLSTNYFNDLIRQSTGLSALKLMHRRMLDIAKMKLSVSSKRMGEIAGELGFQQPQNFSNWFKKMEGCTPQQYRKAIKA